MCLPHYFYKKKKKLGVGIVWFLLHYFKKSTFLASNFHQFQFYPPEQIETRLTGESNIIVVTIQMKGPKWLDKLLFKITVNLCIPKFLVLE